MSTIQIGSNVHSFCDVTESWIQHHVGERKDAGQNVCVTVNINRGSVNVSLTTPGCPGRTSRGRPPNPDETEIIHLWQQLHLNELHWTVGNLTAFVKQARRLVC